MKTNFDHTKKEFQKVRMSDEEKNHVLNSILKRVDMKGPQPSPFLQWLDFFHMRTAALAFVVLLMLSVGGGFALADSALPGDLLYPIKVKVAEPIREALIVNKNAKLDWQVQKVERRLDEAQKLAENGTLDEAKKQIIENHIEENKKVIFKTLKETSSKKTENKTQVHVDGAAKINQNATNTQNMINDSEKSNSEKSKENNDDSEGKKVEKKLNEVINRHGKKFESIDERDDDIKKEVDSIQKKAYETLKEVQQFNNGEDN